MVSQKEFDDAMRDLAEAEAEIERLKAICKLLASGLRGQHASREDMAKLAESAYEQTEDKP